MASTHLDCRGLKCPMPIVRLSIVARDLQAGDELRIDADDPAFRADLHAWARRCNFEVLAFEAGPGGQSARLVKR
ncbi:MAG TPA: sulfurtransferase TusA family protein [Nannocystis sp.]